MIGNIIGYIATIFCCSIYIQRKRNKILILKLISDILWVMHFFLIGGYSAMATTSIAIVRELVFYRNAVVEKENKHWLYIFLISYMISGIISWKNIYSILPVFASTLSTLGFWNKKVLLIKLFCLFSSILMLLYGIYHNSNATIINEIITESLIVVSVVNSITHTIKMKGKK